MRPDARPSLLRDLPFNVGVQSSGLILIQFLVAGLMGYRVGTNVSLYWRDTWIPHLREDSQPLLTLTAQ